MLPSLTRHERHVQQNHEAGTRLSPCAFAPLFFFFCRVTAIITLVILSLFCCIILFICHRSAFPSTLSEIPRGVIIILKWTAAAAHKQISCVAVWHFSHIACSKSIKSAPTCSTNPQIIILISTSGKWHKQDEGVAEETAK